MPRTTEHVPEVSTRSVNPNAREGSREKRQEDRYVRHRQIVQDHFSRRLEGCTSQIRSNLEVDFLHYANTSMGHGSNTNFQLSSEVT